MKAAEARAWLEENGWTVDPVAERGIGNTWATGWSASAYRLASGGIRSVSGPICRDKNDAIIQLALGVKSQESHP